MDSVSTKKLSKKAVDSVGLKRPTELPVGVPRRFAVGAMMVFSTIYAVLFFFLTLVETPPRDFAVIVLFFTIVAAGQAVLFRGTRPREASILAGCAAAPVMTLVASVWNAYLWQDFESVARTIAIGIALMPCGALCGYLVGCLAAGVFYVMDRTFARKDDRPHESSPPIGAVTTGNALWEERVWNFVAAVVSIFRDFPKAIFSDQSNHPETKIRPFRAVAIMFAMTFVVGFVCFVAFAGLPMLRAMATILSISLLLSLVVVGCKLNRRRFNRLLPVCMALCLLPAYLRAGGLVVSGFRLSDVMHRAPGATIALFLMFATILGACFAALAGWLAWLAGRKAWPASRDRLQRRFSITAILATTLLSLGLWNLIHNTRISSAQRTFARILELDGYLDYWGMGWFNLGSPRGVSATGPAIGNDELNSLSVFYSLQWLWLEDSSIDDEATDALQNFVRLSGLSLAGTKVTDDTLKHVGQLSALTSLDLTNTAVSDRGLAELAGRLPSIDYLNLAATGVTGQGLIHVASLASLRQLNLSDCCVTDDGLQDLAGMQWLGTVNLSGTKVTDQGLAYLVKIPQLQRLDLSNTAVTDQGLVHVEKLPKLTYLNLSGTAITDQGLEHLANFQRVDLTGTDVTLEAADRFMAKHPGCIVTIDADSP